MATATWIKNELDEKGLPYEELHHDEAFTAQAVAQKEHISGHRVAKVVVVLADDKPVQLILPASRRVALERVQALLGASHVRLASEAEIQKHFPDCEPGAMPAWRHWPGIEVLMDQSMLGQKDILFQGGTHCDAVHMGFDDWFQMVRPTVAQFSQPCTDWMPRMEQPE
jgi:Ala-tRNA(Pro) deacylase